MKYRLLRLSFMAIFAMLWGNTFAQSPDETITFSDRGYDNAEVVQTVSGVDVTLEFHQGTNTIAPKYYDAGTAVRVYGGNYITVSSETKTIEKVVFTFSGSAYNLNSPTVSEGDYDNQTSTWTGSSSEFTITRGGTSGHARIQKMEFYFASGSGQGGTPTDTRIATAVEVGGDQTGEVGTTMNLPAAVVMDASGAPIDGAAVEWGSSNEDVAKVDGTTLQLLSVGTATITATFAGNDTYKGSEASFQMTVTKPVAIEDGVFDFNLGTDYGSGIEKSAVKAQESTWTAGNVTLTIAGRNCWNDYKAGSTTLGQIRLYAASGEDAAGSLTVAVPNGKVINTITFSGASLANMETAEGEYAAGETTSNYVWTGEANSVTFTATARTDIYTIVVAYGDEQPAEQWTWRDFAVTLTDANVFATDVNSFGVKVAEDGSYTAVAADDETANFAVSAVRFNDKDHGWVNCTFTMKVEGPVLIKLGDCQYGNQKGTITDAEDNVTEIKANASKACWHIDKENNVVATYYRGLEPTTLTIFYEGYCPFIAATAVDPADLPAEQQQYTVSFDIANSGAEGVAPEAATVGAGETFTIPANYTLYKEGYTLWGWSAGELSYAIGTEITVEGDLTLTPVFYENDWNLAERTEAVTLNYNLEPTAVTLNYQNKDGFLVTQATIVGSSSIDVKMPFTTNNGGKLNNVGRASWCQANGGTVFTVPSCKGAVVKMKAFSPFGAGGKTATTIDGQSDYTSSTDLSYTVASSAETVDIVLGNDCGYLSYINITLPKVEQQQGGETFADVAGTIVWPVGNEDAATVSEEIASAVSTATVSFGDGLTVSTRTKMDVAPNQTFTDLKPATANAGTGADVKAEYYVKLAAGLTFKPTSVSYDAVKVGTDNATYHYSYVIDGTESAKVQVSKDDLVRNNNTTGSPAMNHVVAIDEQGGQEFAFRIYVSGFGNTKNLCISNVKISGVVSGTVADVNKYAFAAVASPEEGGSVNVYPAGDEYEEGTELTLTATENFGYDFVNWTNQAGEEVSAEAKFKYTVNADETLTANFQAVETYELALTVDGTNDYMVKISPEPEMVDDKMMYEAGTAVQLTADGYEGLVTFTNWDDGDTNSSKLVSMDADVQLTAMYSQADIIAGWDFYQAGGAGRKADFASADNEAATLNLVYPDGHTSGWLDKSTLAAGGYESFKGAAVNWRNDVAIGTTWWQTKVNAADFQDINVQFQMLYNYNAYQTYNAEYSVDGETWTKFGDITMNSAKTAASFSTALPAEANNQAELYIRMTADKNSKVDGTSSSNDGNTLAMFFITGQPKLVDDGVAPVLVASVPAAGATGVSANGKIVLTFDERVKLPATHMPTATLGSQTLTPTVSGKTVSFEYKGLEYSTEYTFTLPKGSVGDLTDNYIAEDITLTFTTMTRPTVEKKLYDFVVPDDGTFAEALKAAAGRSDKNVRYRIFVKQGDYMIAANQNAKVTANGDHGDGNEYADPRTYFNSPNVSIIGESADNTAITNEMPDAYKDGSNVLEGIRTSGVLYLESGTTDTYFQDLKLHTKTADATGRNVILVDKGTRNVFKNVTLWAYQDTYVPDNGRGLFYFENGIVRGRTDFICGDGDVFFNTVDIIMCEDGGYITAARGNSHYGYVFKDCTIKGGTSKVDGNYYLGRPWTGGAETYFIDTKMEVVPRAAGWHDWGQGPTRYAEYNSVTATGTPVDLSQRMKLFPSNGATNEPVLTAEEALEIGDLHNTFGDWDPTLLTEQAPIPANVQLNKDTNVLTWDDSNYALLYAIVKDGKVIDFTLEPKYTVDDATAAYAVRAANEMGGLSEASATASITTAISEVENAEQQVPQAVYNLGGLRVEKAQKGLYIVNGKKLMVK